MESALKDATRPAERTEPTFTVIKQKPSFLPMDAGPGATERKALYDCISTPNPSLEQLRNQAKDLFKAHKKRDPSGCQVLRHLKQFEGKSDDEVFARAVSLVEAQYALAIHYGFTSWQELKGYAQRRVSAADARINYATLTLKGNGMVMDSFCLALQEACRLLGKEVSYETVLSLTLNAFAPGFDTGNDCKELWVCEAWVSHIGPLHIAWQRLGLSVKPVPLPAPQDNSHGDAYRQACAQSIREAMAAGSVIVTTGGWESRKGVWAEPWWAGIVTQVKEDGIILGAHPNGRTDNGIASFAQGEVFSVRVSGLAPTDGHLDAALLRSVVGRIRAEGDFARRQYCAFGLDAMDEWIAQMAGVPYFCPPCQAMAERRPNPSASAPGAPPRLAGKAQQPWLVR